MVEGVTCWSRSARPTACVRNSAPRVDRTADRGKLPESAPPPAPTPFMKRYSENSPGRSCGRRRRATAKRIVDQGASSNRAQGLPRSSAFSWSGTEATSWYGTEATLEVITKVTVWPRQSTAAGQPRRYAAPSALLRIPARFRRRQRRRVRRDRVVAREQPLAGHRDLTPVPRPTGPWVVARLWLGSRCPPSEERYTIGAARDRRSAVAPYVVRTQVAWSACRGL